MRAIHSRQVAVMIVAILMTGGAAYADPVEHVYTTVNDAVITGGGEAADVAVSLLDEVTDAAASCEKTLDVNPDGQPPLAFTAFTPPDSSSTWFHETSQTKASVNSRCRVGVKAVVCLIDKSVPAVHTVWPRPEQRCKSAETRTGRMITASHTIDVPYLGADAGGVRPYGRIVVRHKGYNLNSRGAWGLPYVCRDDIFIAQPNGNFVQPVDSKEYKGKECPSTLEETLLDPLNL